MSMKTALITGVTGQDGGYLAEYLLSLGYRVVGVSRRTSTPNDERIRHLYDNKNFSVVHGDVTDATSIFQILSRYRPHETYNLAAMSHVKLSFDEPVHSANATYIGCLNILEWMRQHSIRGVDKFYQASSSEMFGSAVSVKYGPEPRSRKDFIPPYRDTITEEPIQDELTPFFPNSPYAIAKLAAHHAVRLYRDSYGVFACSGILFNHESARRSPLFVTRKITKYVAEWANARKQVKYFPNLILGNLEAKRDWGHARDYVKAMHLMLQQRQPDDYVVATGETHSVEEFLLKAFAVVGAVAQSVDDLPVTIDPQLYRPCEVPYLRGDSSKIRSLGWRPEVSFEQLVEEMVLSDMNDIERLPEP